jgi:hypothetical protein
MVAAAIVRLAAYLLLTRMHERYMFLALASFAPLVFVRRLRLVYFGLSALFVLTSGTRTPSSTRSGRTVVDVKRFPHRAVVPLAPRQLRNRHLAEEAVVDRRRRDRSPRGLARHPLGERI